MIHSLSFSVPIPENLRNQLFITLYQCNDLVGKVRNNCVFYYTDPMIDDSQISGEKLSWTNIACSMQRTFFKIVIVQFYRLRVGIWVAGYLAQNPILVA